MSHLIYVMIDEQIQMRYELHHDKLDQPVKSILNVIKFSEQYTKINNIYLYRKRRRITSDFCISTLCVNSLAT